MLEKEKLEKGGLEGEYEEKEGEGAEEKRKRGKEGETQKRGTHKQRKSHVNQ